MTLEGEYYTVSVEVAAAAGAGRNPHDIGRRILLRGEIMQLRVELHVAILMTLEGEYYIKVVELSQNCHLSQSS